METNRGWIVQIAARAGEMSDLLGNECTRIII